MFSAEFCCMNKIFSRIISVFLFVVLEMIGKLGVDIRCYPPFSNIPFRILL